MVTNTFEIGTALRPLRRMTRAARTAVSPRTPRPATHRTRPLLHVAHPHEVERRRVAWTAPTEVGYRGGAHFA